MKVSRVQHYNIRTLKFEESIAFYHNILGMVNKVPPGAPEGWPASWLYDDSGTPVVHLTPLDPTDPEVSLAKFTQYRGGPDKRFPYGFSGSGSIDHVAFGCEGWDEIIARLKKHNVPYTENLMPTMSSRQLFVTDPNGVTLELNFTM